MRCKMFLTALAAMTCSVCYSQSDTQIAFISDPHISDVENHPELIRSLEAQMTSTRLFNENIYAFRAALDDVVSRGVKLVVMPGDMTDDGQVVNQEAMRSILTDYEQKHGVLFFLTVGNHDPKVPEGMHLEVKSYLAADGHTYTAVSDSSLYYKKGDPSVVVRPEIRSVGYADEMNCYRQFGFFPRPEYKYWSTPFSSYSYEQYEYQRAMEEADTDLRQYTYSDTLKAIDASYVVEPIDGLWLLSLDPAVFLPDHSPKAKMPFVNSGIMGYNNLLRYKAYLVDWVRTVASEARLRGKRLITFAHYPLVDCNDDATPDIRRAWGAGVFDVDRMPDVEITDALLEAGVQIHFAGHMHINDIGVKTDASGRTLYNIQVPSVAACTPSYKLLTVKDDGCYRVQTVRVTDVSGFDACFERYRKEVEYAKSCGKQVVWSVETLQSKTYQQLCDWQFRDLTRLRFCTTDLPPILRTQLLPLTGSQLLQRITGRKPSGRVARSFDQWTGFDLILDIYRLHYAGSMAIDYIPKSRRQQYERIFDAVQTSTDDSEFMHQMRCLSIMYHCFNNGEADMDMEF